MSKFERALRYYEKRHMEMTVSGTAIPPEEVIAVAAIEEMFKRDKKNEPLTMDDLMDMHGHSVFALRSKKEPDGVTAMICCVDDDEPMLMSCIGIPFPCSRALTDDGLIYRYKPEWARDIGRASEKD